MMKILKNISILFGFLSITFYFSHISAYRPCNQVMSAVKNKVTFHVMEGDILGLNVDALVNPANKNLRHLGGLCGAIHQDAGPELEAECLTFPVVEFPDTRCKTGNAVITKSYNLKATYVAHAFGAKHVIHAVGPVYENNPHAAEELASAYTNALKQAAAHNVMSIAFPAISTGIFGYPIKEATQIALTTVLNFDYSRTSIRDVYFVVPSIHVQVYSDLLSKNMNTTRQESSPEKGI